jgi:hypothetical protein
MANPVPQSLIDEFNATSAAVQNAGALDNQAVQAQAAAAALQTQSLAAHQAATLQTQSFLNDVETYFSSLDSTSPAAAPSVVTPAASPATPAKS